MSQLSSSEFRVRMTHWPLQAPGYGLSTRRQTRYQTYLTSLGTMLSRPAIASIINVMDWIMKIVLQYTYYVHSQD